MPSPCPQPWLPRRQLRWGPHLIICQQGYVTGGWNMCGHLYRHLAAKTGNACLFLKSVILPGNPMC